MEKIMWKVNWESHMTDVIKLTGENVDILHDTTMMWGYLHGIIELSDKIVSFL